MADDFRPVLEGLKDAAQHMMAANQHMVAANEQLQLGGAALVRTTEAALAAKDEHEDLRESVSRLEGLVMQLSTEVRALRDERRNGGGVH